MKVGVIKDIREDAPGGAELSLSTLLDNAPEGVEIVTSRYEQEVNGVDVWIVGNCASFSADRLVPIIRSAPVVKRVADYWEHGDRVLRDWLLTYSEKLIFSSPIHYTDFYAQDMVHDQRKVEVIPPPVDIAPFVAAREAMPQSDRKNTCWIGQMKNPQQKGVMAAVRWAQRCQTSVDFYGENAPELVGVGDYVKSFPAIPYSAVPQFMARYERFLFLPQCKEPFGRTIIEALAAGCKVVTNAVPGCMWYLETDMPQKIDTATADFWKVVTDVVSDTSRTATV